MIRAMPRYSCNGGRAMILPLGNYPGEFLARHFFKCLNGDLVTSNLCTTSNLLLVTYY